MVHLHTLRPRICRI